MTAIVLRPRPSLAEPMRANLTALTTALAVAAVVEVAILRVFTRTAIHIPGLEALAGPYTVLSGLGRYAFYLATLLLALVLPVLVAALWSHTARGRAAAAAVGVFAAVAALARLSVVDVVVLDAGAVAAVAMLGFAAAAGGRTGLATLPLVAAVALFGAHAIWGWAAQQGLVQDPSDLLVQGAEWPALAFALLCPVAFGVRPSRLTFAGAVCAAMVTAALFFGNASTSRILLLWNAGLTGALPSVLYAAAAGTLVFTGLALLRSGRTLAAQGLLLVLVGGLGVQNSYQSALVVTGLALIVIESQRAAIAARAR